MRGVGRVLPAMGLGMLWAAGAAAAEASDPALLPRFEGSEVTSARALPGTTYPLLVAPVAGADRDDASLRIEGRAERVAYRAAPGKTAADLYGHYLLTLSKGGFQVLFQCQGFACGGAQFNSAIAAAGSDLKGLDEEQRYVAARLPRPGGDLYVSVYVSAPGAAAAGPGAALAQVDVISASQRDPDALWFTSTYGIKLGLDQNGHIALYDLTFQPGSSALPLDAKPAIQKIAQFLSETPSVDVLIVSHTSAEESPERALALTRARAQEIVNALVSEFGVASHRVYAVGAGNAAPVASPRTLAGRKLNERIEIVLR